MLEHSGTFRIFGVENLSVLTNLIKSCLNIRSLFKWPLVVQGFLSKRAWKGSAEGLFNRCSDHPGHYDVGTEEAPRVTSYSFPIALRRGHAWPMRSHSSCISYECLAPAVTRFQHKPLACFRRSFGPRLISENYKALTLLIVI